MPRSYCVSGSLGSMRNGFAKLSECGGVVALTAQRDAEHGIRTREFWIRARSLGEIERRQDRVCRVGLRRGRVRSGVRRTALVARAFLSSVSAPDGLFCCRSIRAMSSRALTLAGSSWMEACSSLSAAVLVAEFELRCAEGEVRVGPFRFEANRFFEFFGGLLGLAFVFQRERQVVVRVGVVRFEFERFAIVGDGGSPRTFAARVRWPACDRFRRFGRSTERRGEEPTPPEPPFDCRSRTTSPSCFVTKRHGRGVEEPVTDVRLSAERTDNSDRCSAATQRLTGEAGTDFVPAHPCIYVRGSDYQ